MGDFAEVDEWKTDLQRRRERRQELIHAGSGSGEDSKTVGTLAYYDLDPAYRVRAKLDIDDIPRIVQMQTTAGRLMQYHRIGTLSFTLEDDSYELGAYQVAGQRDDALFVPFCDETAGEATYEHGRYLGLTNVSALESGDEIVLDFNTGYLPFCAYSAAYDCPIPPEENHLDVRIEAGERLAH